MDCEKLRRKIYRLKVDACRRVMSIRPELKEEMIKNIKNTLKEYSIKQLRDEIMSMGVGRALIDESRILTDASLENRYLENRYKLASEYKFCFLESFTKDETYETDPSLIGFYRDSVPNMLEILKEIRVMEENNAEILPKIDQIERCLKEGKYWDAVDITDEVYNHYIVPGDNLKEGYRYELPTKAYNLYGVQNGHLIATINILDVALKLEWIISQLKEQGYVFKRPWDRYLPRIIEGLRRFEIKAFDHFDLCIVGSYALQDEFDDDTTEAVRDAWQKVVDSMESVECYTKRNYPYPLLKRPRPGRSFYPLPEPSAYINRK